VNQKGKILVVDDDRLVLATLTHGLSQAGYEVIDADNGDDAILLARQHKPELALLDIRMEGKSGFDVAAYLREYCQIPFMFLSAFADEATIKQVKELGALTYLVKPLDIQQIVPAVESAFANRPQAHAQTPAQAPVQPPAAAPVPSPDPLTQTVAVAVGVVMHRHSLSRRQALERLQHQAQQEGHGIEALCERLINAQEVLAGLGSI
jgi:DNA-binding response OmpR family regulator